MNSERKIMRGEVYYIKSFPTVGHEQRSGRPAVIVSNNENNAHSGTFEICYLTLQDKPKLPTHVFIDRGPCINSTVLCEQITTVAQDKVGDFMCTVPDDIMDKIDKALAVSLALTSERTKLNASIRGNDLYQVTPKAVMDELNSLKNENVALKHELDSAHTVLEDFNFMKSKADMFERMYNDLLDRLVKRG